LLVVVLLFLWGFGRGVFDFNPAFVGYTGGPYSFTAQKVFGVTDTASCKKAKTIFLATIYGQGRNGLAAKLGCSLDDATGYLNSLAVAFPELGVPTYDRVNGEWFRSEINTPTYKAEIEMLLRLTGRVTSLFGRQRCFAGLKALRECDLVTVLYHFEGRNYDVELAPVQLWNYALHAYVYSVRNHENGKLLATDTKEIVATRFAKKAGLCRWPFRQLSYKSIRSVTTNDGRIVKFEPLQDIYREGFNSVIQMTAGDVFKKAILTVQPVVQQHGARLLLPVHDELVFAVPTPNLAGFVAGARAAMTKAPALWWTVPIEVEVKVGDNYGALTVYP
jgi:hypothetical protein